MKTLMLIIKQKFFDEIISGNKKQEFRELKPTTYKKYVVTNENGEAVEEDGIFKPIDYDSIQFYVGYNKDRDQALVEVKGAVIEILTDEDGKDIIYEYECVEYLLSQITYDLGKVISVTRGKG